MNQAYTKIPFYPVFFLLIAAVKNGGISLSRLHIFLIYLLRYTLLEPFRLIQVYWFYGKIRRHEITEDPIFVLGHWRSGTSHLQNLMVQGGDKTTSTIFTGLFADNYLVTGFWLKGVLNFIIKTLNAQYSIQRVPMHLDIPVELDSSLCAMVSPNCYTWGQVFPIRFEKWIDKMVLFDKEQAAGQWISDYDFMIKKLSYHSGGKRVVVKTPGDTARMLKLYQKYPNARFIYIHRDPIAVYHSNLYLWSVIQKENSVQKLSDNQINTLIIKTYQKLLSAYLKQRAFIPSSQLVEVHFEDLQKSPLATVKHIYSTLNLGPIPEKALAELIETNKSYKVKKYNTAPDLEATIKSQWDFAFKTWNN